MFYCNPINLPYPFETSGHANPDYSFCRESADPSLILHNGIYWLFASKFDGYFCSDDLVQWNFIHSETLPVKEFFYAPDVVVIDEVFYWSASGCEFVYSNSDPRKDAWKKSGKVVKFADPKIFQDDNGKIYLYNGCSCKEPLCGIELSSETLAPCGSPAALYAADPKSNGWERFEENNFSDSPPWLEGAWMNKIGGVYYLQYAIPGTEQNTYCDAVLISHSPLGPFRLQKQNPFSLKASGYITGAGHGSTFFDKGHNLWHITTGRISIRYIYERRICLYPAGIDKNGELFCMTRFGDYPHKISGWEQNPSDSFSGWMLQSYRSKVKASSQYSGFKPEHAVDESIQTCWAAEKNDPAPWLELDLGKKTEVHALQINFAEVGCKKTAEVNRNGYHRYLVEVSDNGVAWKTQVDKMNNTSDVPHDFFVMHPNINTRFLRLRIMEMPGDGHPSVSGFRVFGFDYSGIPEPPDHPIAERSKSDPCMVKCSWKMPENAYGVNILWGTSPDTLNNCFQTLEIDDVTFHFLRKNLDYHVSFEAFGRGGVSRRTTPIFLKVPNE